MRAHIQVQKQVKIGQQVGT